MESVRETWATKSPREAHKVLSGPNIQVTNLSDKTIHLGKIMELDNEVHQAFQKTEVCVCVSEVCLVCVCFRVSVFRVWSRA